MRSGVRFSKSVPVGTGSRLAPTIYFDPTRDRGRALRSAVATNREGQDENTQYRLGSRDRHGGARAGGRGQSADRGPAVGAAAGGRGAVTTASGGGQADAASERGG